jgi:cobaltochelatase CobT
MSDKNALEIEDRTKSAYRAVSGDVNGDISFGGGKASLISGASRLMAKNKKITARLPAPVKDDPIDTQPHLRGASDGAALYRKYHKDAKQSGLNTIEGQALFDVLEQVRCEALGARQMDGVGANLSAALESECVRKKYLTHTDIPMEDSLYALAYASLSECTLGHTSKHTANQIAMQIEQKFGEHAFDEMIKNLDNQNAYAHSSEQFIRVLMNMDLPSDDNSETNPDPDESGADGQTQIQGEDAEQGSEGDSDTANDQPAQIETTDGETDGNTQSSMMGEDWDNTADDDPDGSGDIQGENQDGQLPPTDPFDDRAINYQIYTNEHDEVIEPSKLADATELQALRDQLDAGLQPLQALIGKLANRLQRRLMARQQRQWRFDEEEGILNTSRLARIIADPNLPLTYKQEIETDFRDTVLTLLIDNSGSMRGRPITTAALTADILARTLERTGVKVEVLGFTTANWKGGKSRQLWTQNARPPMPGRLNDIRHIIYKNADAPLRRTRNNLGLMLKEGILKENIDGEALLWAYKRLQSRPEDRKILMVISDGAPVDDSTLSANRSGYLESDLRNVIHAIDTRGDVELTAIGIGHDVGKYYKRAITIRDSADLPPVMMNELADLFDR